MKVKVIIFIGMLALAAILAAAYYFFLYNPGLPDYVIPGVEYITVYSPETFYPRLFSREAVFMAIINYWGKSVNAYDEKSIDDIEDIFRESDILSFFAKLNDYFVDRGFAYQVGELRTPADAKKYINPSVKTPLFFAMPFSKEYPNALFWQYRLLIGVNEKTRIYTFHDYYYGKNYEMSFDEFDELINSRKSDYPDLIGDRLRFVAIQPADLESALKNLQKNPAPYPPNEEIAVKLRPLIPDYLAGIRLALVGPDNDESRKESVAHLTKVVNSPLFDLLHPVNKIFTLSTLAKAEVALKLMESAKEHLSQADGLNKNLDQPVPGWPAMSSLKDKKVFYAYEAWSEYYSALGDSANARKFAREAELVEVEYKAAVRQQILARP